MPKKLILDVDTGTDDAIALMLAALHPDLELVAATTVNGNNPVRQLHRQHAARVRPARASTSRSTRGWRAPLVRDDFPIPRAVLHAKGSMHGLELPIPQPRSVKRSQRAVEFLIETYMAATEPIALVPVGPLTNIAMAIKLEPRIVERIPEMVIMGGGHEVGNTTPSAEFNVWVDPEAARDRARRPACRTSCSCPWMRRTRPSSPSTTAVGCASWARRRARRRRRSSRGGSRLRRPPADGRRVTARRSTTRCASPTSSTRPIVSGRRVHVDVETHGELTIGPDGHGHPPGLGQGAERVRRVRRRHRAVRVAAVETLGRSDHVTTVGTACRDDPSSVKVPLRPASNASHSAW